MPVAAGETLDPRRTRRRILDAAAELFYARGVNAVGVNEIAAAAGASKVSLYRNFESKDDRVAAVVAERSDRVHAWLRAGSDDAPAGTARILKLFDLLAEWFAEPGFRGCAVLNTAADTRGATHSGERDAAVEIAATVHRHLERYLELLAERLAELEPPPADADLLARQLLVLIEGATVVAAARPDEAARSLAAARAAAAALVAGRS